VSQRDGDHQPRPVPPQLSQIPRRSWLRSNPVPRQGGHESRVRPSLVAIALSSSRVTGRDPLVRDHEGVAVGDQGSDQETMLFQSPNPLGVGSTGGFLDSAGHPFENATIISCGPQDDGLTPP